MGGFKTLNIKLKEIKKVKKQQAVRQNIKTESKKRRSNKKTCQPAHNKFVRDLIQEICGLQPYEKRAVNVLSDGRDKKCQKYLTKRLGSLKRGKKKQDEIQRYLKKYVKLANLKKKVKVNYKD